MLPSTGGRWAEGARESVVMGILMQMQIEMRKQHDDICATLARHAKALDDTQTAVFNTQFATAAISRKMDQIARLTQAPSTAQAGRNDARMHHMYAHMSAVGAESSECPPEREHARERASPLLLDGAQATGRETAKEKATYITFPNGTDGRGGEEDGSSGKLPGRKKMTVSKLNLVARGTGRKSARSGHGASDRTRAGSGSGRGGGGRVWEGGGQEAGGVDYTPRSENMTPRTDSVHTESQYSSRAKSTHSLALKLQKILIVGNREKSEEGGAGEWGVPPGRSSSCWLLVRCTAICA